MKHLPVAEVRRRLTQIARADIVRLNWLARLYAAKLGRDATDELLDEAITRALEGRRPWPADVAIVAFLAGVMKSIASEWRGKAERDPLRRNTVEIDDAVPGLPTDESHEAEAAIHILIAHISARLSDEPLLRGLFELRLNDRSPAQIQAALSLDANAFDRAMRGLKQRLLEIFPAGYPL
jgi:DNA-directed RNA polymerase specialized sigma24 family protein